MNILVVDDHILFREGLVNMLRSQPDLIVVGEAGTGTEAIAKARELKPDLILLDYSLPDGNGTDTARIILTELPNTKIVFLTIHDDDAYLMAAIRSGAIGYLVKDVAFAKLVSSIRAVEHNEPAISRNKTLSLMRAIAHPSSLETSRDAGMAMLTTREVEILRDLAADASNEDIAEHLSLSLSTVKNNIHQIFHKLNLKNRKEVASYARLQGFGRRNHS